MMVRLGQEKNWDRIQRKYKEGVRWGVLRYANGIAGKKDKWKGRKESEKEID